MQTNSSVAPRLCRPVNYENKQPVQRLRTSGPRIKERRNKPAHAPRHLALTAVHAKLGFVTCEQICTAPYSPYWHTEHMYIYVHVRKNAFNERPMHLDGCSRAKINTAPLMRLHPSKEQTVDCLTIVEPEVPPLVSVLRHLLYGMCAVLCDLNIPHLDMILSNNIWTSPNMYLLQYAYV